MEFSRFRMTCGACWRTGTTCGEAVSRLWNNSPAARTTAGGRSGGGRVSPADGALRDSKHSKVGRNGAGPADRRGAALVRRKMPIIAILLRVGGWTSGVVTPLNKVRGGNEHARRKNVPPRRPAA